MKRLLCVGWRWLAAAALAASLAACGSSGKPAVSAGGSGGGAGGTAGRAGSSGAGGAGVAGGGASGAAAGASGAGGRAGAGGGGAAGGGAGRGGASGADGGAGAAGSPAGGHSGSVGTGGGAGAAGSPAGGHSGSAGGGAGGRSNGPDGGTDAQAAGPPVVTKLAIDANRMVYDAVRGRLYASVRHGAPVSPDTVVVIDPVTMSVVTSLPVGKDPGPLALSDDGSTLWVGLTGDDTFRSITVTDSPPTVNAIHPVPMGQHVMTMVVLPGTRTSVVASMGFGGDSTVTAFDDGVARPTAAKVNLATRVCLGPAGYVFGYDGYSSADTFWTFAVSSAGVTVVKSAGGLVDTIQNEIIYVPPRVYASFGEVVDVSSPANPIRAGKFDFVGAVGVRDAGHLLMMSPGIYNSTTNPTLRVLDEATFTQTAWVTVPWDIDIEPTNFHDLAYLGGDRLAVVGDDGSAWAIYFIQSSVIGAP